jgi:hypothetical protein
MEKTRKWKVLVMVALLVSISGIGIAFAALSTTLNITGTSIVNGPNWSVKFANLGTVAVTGAAVADGTPVLSDTSISDVKSIFNGDGTMSYEFDVVNGGLLNATIGTLTLLTPTCTGTGVNAATDQTLVCGALSTTLTYVADSATVAVADTLNSGITKRMKYTITYNAGGTYPENPVNVTGLGATIIYNEVQ